MKSISATISLPRTNWQGGCLQLDTLSSTGAGSFSEPIDKIQLTCGSLSPSVAGAVEVVIVVARALIVKNDN